jgi:predicted Zn-dependent protease
MSKITIAKSIRKFFPQKGKIIFILTLLIITSPLPAEMITYEKVLQNLKGIKNFDSRNFEEADKIFQDNALNHPNDPALHFNRGNSLLKKGELDAAQEAYKMALRNKDFSNRSQALQNMGNASFLAQDYKNAVKYYRDALIEEPDNIDARYNYELAARMLQKQQQSQNQQQDQNESEENEEQNQQKQQQQQQQDKTDKQEDAEQEDQISEAEQKDREEAERIIRALLQKEQEDMKKEKEKLQAERPKKGKYW